VDQAPLSVADRAAAVADSVLAPAAEQVDVDGSIPNSHFEALAGAGLFGILGPTETGGSDVSASVARRTMAHIASGCGSTFFVWAQHHGVVRTLRSSSNDALRDPLLPSLCAGEQIAGVAFAHARRVGEPPVRARRHGNGWRLDGFAPWTTSWGIAQQFAIAAETDGGQLVWSMISANTSAGIEPQPLPLPVLAATGTVALRLNDCVVDDSNVITIMDADTWRSVDRRTASIGSPAVLGVAHRAIRLLAGAARSSSDAAASTATALQIELDSRWGDDEELLACVLGFDEDDIATASTHRARCLDLGQRSTTALLAASGGRGMDLRNPAQRLAREAMFYVIQAQTNDGRSGTLDYQRR
jgi:alkylation response protein AidB-like acyl-CoA dehydrogenase